MSNDNIVRKRFGDVCSVENIIEDCVDEKDDTEFILVLSKSKDGKLRIMWSDGIVDSQLAGYGALITREALDSINFTNTYD